MEALIKEYIRFWVELLLNPTEEQKVKSDRYKASTWGFGHDWNAGQYSHFNKKYPPSNSMNSIQCAIEILTKIEVSKLEYANILGFLDGKSICSDNSIIKHILYIIKYNIDNIVLAEKA